MKVKAGYKLTEVGVIPEEWEASSWGKLATLEYGKSLRGYENTHGSYPVYGTNGPIGTHTKMLCKHPGVIVGRKGAYRGIHFSKEPFYVIDTAYYLESKEDIDLKWAYYELLTHDINYVDSGSAIPSTSRETFYNLSVIVPPLPEQSAIATTLSDVDDLLTSLDKLIAKKRDIKRATMQQLLTGKTRLPGFGEELKPGYKQTEVGMIPSDWEPTPLGRISAFITKGATPTTYGFSWVNDGVLFLRSECVSEQGLDLTQSMFITPAAHNVLKRGEVRAGDILITITGNVGRVIYLSNDFGIANINQHIARIRIIDINVAADYVFHFLSQPTIRKYYSSIITGQAYPQISLKQVRDTRVPIPPTKAEQQAIAAILTDMDAEIAALEQKRDKTRALKQGMMQELLTGKTRLI